MKIDKKIIAELTGYLKEFNLSEIEYAEGTTKVKVSRSITSSSTAIAPSETKKKQEVLTLLQNLVEKNLLKLVKKLKKVKPL